jgi:hypothetical protein
MIPMLHTMAWTILPLVLLCGCFYAGLFNLPEKCLGAPGHPSGTPFCPRKDAASRRKSFRDLPEGSQDPCEPSKR